MGTLFVTWTNEGSYCGQQVVKNNKGCLGKKETRSKLWLGRTGLEMFAGGERNTLRRVKLEAIALDRDQDFVGCTEDSDGRERKE